MGRIWEEKTSRKRAKPEEDDETEPTGEPAVKRAKPDVTERAGEEEILDIQTALTPEDSSSLDLGDVEENTPMALDADGKLEPVPTNKTKGSVHTFKENPYTYLTEDNELLADCL